MNRPHHLHPLDHPAERGKTLPVRVPHASEIERRLIADADEEAVRGRVRAGTPHRDRAVNMQDPRIGGPLQRDRREGVRRRLGISAAISAALDDRDPDGIVGLVFGVHGAEEGAAVVVPTVQVAEEVAGGHGSPVDIDLQFEGAHFGFDDDPHGIVGCWWGEREAAGHERQ